MMNALLISDLHLTDRPHDEYRWKVFMQAAELSRKYELSDLFVLGDVTEFKDFHSSKLVNQIVDSFYVLRKISPIKEVHFLKGNHDGLDPAHPYFHFLRRLPWAHFYVEPSWIEKGKKRILFLPHTKHPEEEWPEVAMMAADYIFLHGTMTGARSENGQELEGLSGEWFKKVPRTSSIYAGDIHVPQRVGQVEYVGAPYPIRFGDSFQGRAIALVNDKRIDCPLDNLRKITLTLKTAPGIKLEKDWSKAVRPGDQAKVIIALTDAEMGEWQARKQWVMDFCTAHELSLQKLQLERLQPLPSKKPTLRLKQRTPEESVQAYCRTNSIDPALERVGLRLLQHSPSSTP